jgi:hypothetical protein
MCRGRASRRKRRLDRRQRDHETHAQAFIAQPLEFARESGIALASCVRRKCSSSRDEEIGPGERFGLGKVFKGLRIALHLVEISKIERHIHGIGIKAQLIMGETSGLDESLGVRQSSTPRFRLFERGCKRTQNVSAVERSPEILAQGYRLVQEIDRLGTMPFGEG